MVKKDTLAAKNSGQLKSVKDVRVAQAVKGKTEGASRLTPSAEELAEGQRPRSSASGCAVAGPSSLKKAGQVKAMSSRPSHLNLAIAPPSKMLVKSEPSEDKDSARGRVQAKLCASPVKAMTGLRSAPTDSANRLIELIDLIDYDSDGSPPSKTVAKISPHVVLGGPLM